MNTQNARIAKDTEDPKAVAIGNFRYECGTDYAVAFRSAGELRALLDPIDCEYTLVVKYHNSAMTNAYKATPSGMYRVHDIVGKDIRQTKYDVFAGFYTAETFTITDLVDKRPRVDKHGRTTYTDSKTVTCHHPSKEEHIHFHLDSTYQLTELALWKVRALERPLDCRYAVVVESATLPSRSRDINIAPGSAPELICLHNWDTITITDIRKGK